MNTSETEYLTLLRSREIGLVEVPRKSKTHAICLAAVTANGLDLYHVPKYMRSETIHYAAIYQNPKCLELIDMDYLKGHQDLVEFAVSRKGNLLHWLVKNLPEVITYNVCLRAVKSTGAALAFVPARQLDEVLIRIASENDASALNHVFLNNSDVVKRAVSEVIKTIPLKHLPDHFKTYEICLNQVEQQGRQLNYVPFPLIDERMVSSALASNPWAIEYVPITFSDLKVVADLISSGAVPEHVYSHIANGVEFI